MRINNIFKITLIAGLAVTTVSCVAGLDEPEPGTTGTRAYAEVTLGKAKLETRTSTNSYDHWTIADFNAGDRVGMYAVSGRQNPDNLDDYTLPVDNGIMYYEGRTDNVYRFGNSDIVLRPQTVAGSYSIMYWPYDAEMPPVTETSTSLKGIELRQIDATDGIEKCLDFMHTSGNYIAITNGVLKPTFNHYMSSIGIQRGEGFRNPPTDSRIWLVTKTPYTDIRVRKPSSYSYQLQYNPTESEEDLMIDIIPDGRFKVNKYCVWQAWEGSPYSNVDTKYVVVPPQEVYFILIQDDYGNWQYVGDFYLSTNGNKKANSNTRYIVTVELQGINVTVRPVAVMPWDEEIEITDNRKVGINNYQEYNSWVSAYNAYIQSGRSDDYGEVLKNYGDGVLNTVTGRTSWTFYINNNLEFPNNEFYTVTRLEDVIEGSSTYTNYTVTNIRGTMFGEMSSTGGIRALDFYDIYLVQPSDEDTPFGAFVGKMEGGLVENCNIINGIIVSENPAGIVAGSCSGGTVRNCKFSGDVIGKSSAPGSFEGIFGELNGIPVLDNVMSIGLKFIEN